MNSAEFEFDFDNREDAERVLAALKPELSSAPSDRADVVLEAKGNRLLLRISSRKKSPFRAAVSTYLRWIRVAHEVGMI